MLKGAIKNLLNDDVKTRKIGVFIAACGIGLVAVSYVR